MESGAGSTVDKFGLLIILANICLKLLVGIGIWKLAMDEKNIKNTQVNKSFPKIEEQNFEQGNDDILKMNNNEKTGRIYPSNDEDGDKFKYREESSKE